MISSLWHFPCIRSPGGTRGARSIKTNEKFEYFLLRPKGEGLHFSTLFSYPTGKIYGVCERCCHTDSGGTNLPVKTWRVCEYLISSEPPHPPQQPMKRPLWQRHNHFRMVPVQELISVAPCMAYGMMPFGFCLEMIEAFYWRKREQ